MNILISQSLNAKNATKNTVKPITIVVFLVFSLRVGQRTIVISWLTLLIKRTNFTTSPPPLMVLLIIIIQ